MVRTRLINYVLVGTVLNGALHAGPVRRFLACYAILCLIDSTALGVFADKIGVPDQTALRCACLVSPLLAFLMRKHRLFAEAADTGGRMATRTSR